MYMYKCICFVFEIPRALRFYLHLSLFLFREGGGYFASPPHTRAIFFLFVANGPTHTTAPYKKALHERFLGIVDPDDRVAFKLRSKHISTHKMHYGAYVV